MFVCFTTQLAPPDPSSHKKARCGPCCRLCAARLDTINAEPASYGNPSAGRRAVTRLPCGGAEFTGRHDQLHRLQGRQVRAQLGTQVAVRPAITRRHLCQSIRPHPVPDYTQCRRYTRTSSAYSLPCNVLRAPMGREPLFGRHDCSATTLLQTSIHLYRTACQHVTVYTRTRPTAVSVSGSSASQA